MQGKHTLCHALDGWICEKTEEPKEEKACQDLQENVRLESTSKDRNVDGHALRYPSPQRRVCRIAWAHINILTAALPNVSVQRGGCGGAFMSKG